MSRESVIEQAGGPIALVTGALGVVIVIAAVVGIYIDARRRVGPGESLVWAAGNLMLQPLALPLYLWRAYSQPERVPTPAVMIPWVRAMNYLSASVIVAMVAAVAVSVVWALAAAVTGASLDEPGPLAVAIQGIIFAPVMIAWTYLFRYLVDRRQAQSVGTPLELGSSLKANALGLLIGLGLVGIAAGAMLAVGAVESRGTQGAKGVASLALLFVPVYLSAFFEEIVLRGYLQRTLYLSWGHAGAVAGSAACFGLLHAWNPGIGWLGVVNILLVGVLLSLIVIRTNEIWTVTGVHFGWNLMLGPVLGLPVSGVQLDSIVRLEPTGDASFLAGGEFGPEASPLVSVVLLVAIAVVGAMVARRRRWHEPPDEEAERPVEPPPSAYDASYAPSPPSSEPSSSAPPREPEARPEPPASQ